MTAMAEVCAFLKSNSTLQNGQRVITYTCFAESRQICREKYGDLYDICFWPRVFFSFPSIRMDMKEGVQHSIAVETRCLVRYVQEFERILQTKTELNLLAKDGRLTSARIIEFTNRKLRSFYALKAKNRPYMMAACKLASYKLKFYHEKRGHALVEDVALGTTAWELEKALKFFREQDRLNEERSSNWFSDKVIFNILDVFLQVAGESDGYIDYEEFSSLSIFSSFSPLFRECLFLQLKTDSVTSDASWQTEGLMDLEEYAKLVLAWNDRNSSVAVKHLFKIFDRHRTGYLTPKDILFFVQETVHLLQMDDSGAVYEEMADDLVTEIIDIISPSDSGKITSFDIINSKNGYEVFGMMADATELYRHEHKDDQ